MSTEKRVKGQRKCRKKFSLAQMASTVARHIALPQGCAAAHKKFCARGRRGWGGQVKAESMLACVCVHAVTRNRKNYDIFCSTAQRLRL